MKKTLSVIYGALGYLAFLGVYLYLAAFSLNLAPHSVSGPSTLPPAIAVLVDIALVAVFGLQHSIMARSEFKASWTRIVPPHLERSTFVWIASAIVALIVLAWQPVGVEIWNVTGTGMVVLYAISALGWLMVPVASLFTDHFHLFGLRQVAEYAMGRPQSQPVFRERAMYKKVRHPMMLAFLVAFWSTPHMTGSHLLFAGLMTSYILAGIYFEERALVEEHGVSYRSYQERVPKLFPTGERTGSDLKTVRTRAAVAQGK